MNQQKRRRQRQLREQRRKLRESTEAVNADEEENGLGGDGDDDADFDDDDDAVISTSSKSVSFEDHTPIGYNNDKPVRPVTLLRERLYSRRNIDTSIYNSHLTDVDGESLTEKYLSPDVYSLIYVCNHRSVSMIYCGACVLFQFTVIALLILAASNALNDEKTTNFFKVPIDVDREVRISQLFAIILLVVSQDDFIYGISFFFDGYSPEILKKAPYATLTKFYIAGTLKMCEAGSCLFITFILIVQSSTVIGLFLNFAALAFVYCIDDVFFNLAGSFMFSDELAILVSQVRTMMVPIPFRVPSYKDSVSSYRFINLVHTISILVVGWMLITIRQLEGNHACPSLRVQFGDEAIAALSMYSGPYDRMQFLGQEKYQLNHRFVYIRRDPRDAMFAYCKSTKTWNFIADFNGETYQTLDPCGNSTMAQSAETETYDILDTTNSPWSTINLQTSNDAIIDFFTMVCNECGDGDCYGRGKCEDNVCVCNKDAYGLDCQFDVVCDNLTESFNHDLFQNNITGPFQIFSRSSEFLANHRPIYFRYTQSQALAEYIMFLGRRWGYFTSVEDNEQIDGIEVEDEDAAYKLFVQNLTEQFSNIAKSVVIPFDYLPVLLSDPVTYGTAWDTGAPYGVSWYETVKVPFYVAADSSKPKNSRLLCPTCSDISNPCQYSGVCTANATCDCGTKYEGSLCEKKL